MKPLRVLSLFDGISCLRVALGDRPIDYYGAAEIDINAIAVSMNNWDDITPLGDVCTLKGIENIDLLCGGSPCTDLSIAKKDREGLKGDHSKLFYEFVRILKETKPRYFLLENVASMRPADKNIISAELGVEPIMIDAALVSAQSRKRLFWTNIPVKGLPEDRNITLKDILQTDVGEEYYTKSTAKRVMKAVKTDDSKANCLLATSWKGAGANGMTNITTIEKKNESFDQLGYVGAKNACGVGGQALRIYDTNKKAPTSGVGLYAVGHLGDTNAQANRIYDADGKSCTLSANGGGLGAKTGLYQVGYIGNNYQNNRVYSEDGKCPTITKGSPVGGHVPIKIEVGVSIRAHKIGEEWVDKVEHRKDSKISALTTTFAGKLALVGELEQKEVKRIRKLTPVECERLQSLPDNYTDCVSKTQRYRCLGNAFNVEVIKFILSFMPEE